MSVKKTQSKNSLEACEGILAILKASQRQLEYLAHEHLDFSQVLALEQKIRVGGSPERAEIQRFRLLLDARLDHVRQLRALTSLAPLTFTPSDKARIERLQEALELVDKTATPQTTESAPQKTSAPPPPEPVAEPPEPVAEPIESVAEPPEPVAEPIESVAVLPEPTPSKGPNSETATSPESPQKQSTDTPSVEPLAAAPTEAAIPLGSGKAAANPARTGLSLQVTTTPPVTEPNPVQETPVLNNDLKSLMRIATQAHSEGELENAIDAYSDLLDQQPEHLPALLARGRCHLEKKDYTAAVSDFRRAQNLDKGSTGALIALGDLYFARKNHNQAIAFFDQAIAIESNHAQARCRRGLAHYHSGRYRQAFLDLQRAYKLDPEIPNIRRLVQMAIRKLEESA